MDSKLKGRKKRYAKYQPNYVSQSPEGKKQMSKERSKRYQEKLKGDPHKKAPCSAKAKLRVEKRRALKRKLQN